MPLQRGHAITNAGARREAGGEVGESRVSQGGSSRGRVEMSKSERDVEEVWIDVHGSRPRGSLTLKG
jgi:hypothetical protein